MGAPRALSSTSKSPQHIGAARVWKRASLRKSGTWSWYLSTTMWAARPGPGRPRSIGCNLVSDPCPDARTYVAELGKALETRIDVSPMPAGRSYMADLGKWLVKCLIRHAGRRLPSYRDWQTRSHQASFDCSLAKHVLGWNSVVKRERMREEGARRPAAAWLAWGPNAL
jgi:hypothetical protein